MKQLFFTLTFVTILLLTSCQFSENIYMQEDGSGKMTFSMDASELMKMAGDEMSKDGEKSIDSILYFKDFLEAKKDSISKLSQEEQEKLKNLEAFGMHMVMDSKEQTMKFDLFSDFNSISELDDLFKAMNNVSNFQGEGGVDTKDTSNPFSAMANANGSELTYSLKGNLFKRETVMKDQEVYKTLVDSMGDLTPILASSTYKLNYHFPRKIKSASHEDALFSEDKKTMTLELNFMDYLKNPELLNVEVELEDE